MKQETSCNCLFEDYSILLKVKCHFHYSSRTKIGTYHLCFLKKFNNFENRFSMNQLWTAASSFPQTSWSYLMKRIFVAQNIREPINYLSFLPDRNAMNFILWKMLRAKIKSAHVFFISNSIFHLSLRLPREDLNFRLKVTKKLLTR